jgi:hypothetical protein
VEDVVFGLLFLRTGLAWLVGIGVAVLFGLTLAPAGLVTRLPATERLRAPMRESWASRHASA